jgi:hypothetical protein
MKLVRNLAAALVLACALTVNVYAGDQDTPGFVPPPPRPATSVTTSDKTTTTSETDGKVVLEAEEPDLLVTALMTLLSLY